MSAPDPSTSNPTPAPDLSRAAAAANLTPLPAVNAELQKATIVAQGDVLYSGWLGMALGYAVVLPAAAGSPSVRKIDSSQVEQQCARLEGAIKVLQDKYPEDYDLNAKNAELKLVYSLMVRDHCALGEICKTIREELVDAATAAYRYYDLVLSKASARNGNDVIGIRDELMIVLTGQHDERKKKLEALRNCDRPTILIAKSLSPVEMADLDPKNVKAILLNDRYDYDSHICQGAQSSGAIALCQVRRRQGRLLTDSVQDGDLVLVDARTLTAFSRIAGDGTKVFGNIIVNPALELAADYEGRLKKESSKSIIPLTERYSRTKDFEEVHLRGVVSNINALDRLVAMKVRGIALVRTEMMLIDHCGRIADEEQQTGMYSRILRALTPDQANFRTFDIRPEFNVRGTLVDSKSQEVLEYLRFTFREQGREGELENNWEEIYEDILRTQIRSMLRAHILHGNARIFFPMIEDPEDLDRKIALVGTEWNKLTKLNSVKLDLGAMIETVLGVDQADAIMRRVAFTSVGTGDLTNSVLKTQRGVSFLPHHPLVLDRLARLVETAKGIKSDYKLYVCGPMVQYYYFPVLLGLGYRRFSPNIDDINKVNALLQRITISDCEALVKAMRRCEKAEDGKKLLDQFHKELASEPAA